MPLTAYRQGRFGSSGAVVGVSRLEDGVKCLLCSISNFLIEDITFERVWITLVMSELPASNETFEDSFECMQVQAKCLPDLLGLLTDCTPVL